MTEHDVRHVEKMAGGVIDPADPKQIALRMAVGLLDRRDATIERLRRALRNASRELSPVRHQSPQYIYDDLLHDAAGGGDG